MFEFMLGTIFVLTTTGIGAGLVVLLWLSIYMIWKDL